ncbi:hypothetical protein [Haloplanus salinarum]|uniref:hypothetical protein n=1 Tax=Haloplanus salinarum TaxID=1912324 RepID=UPI00214C22E0|nr:hypothetical protein [Haloplanus salinarum]
MSQCEYCSNNATRNAYNKHTVETESLCEIHYAYLKPSSATVNPVNIGRCMRCGEKALNNDGTEERLIEHHVNYPLDLTVPICDSCHTEIHSGSDPVYLERYERQNSPYDPVGSKDAEGVAIHRKYRNKPTSGEACPNCDSNLIFPPDGMGFSEPHLCPNSECSLTDVSASRVI